MAKTYPKLRGKIVEVYGNQRAFADILKVSEQTVTAKMNGRSEFSQEDIIKWSDALNIDAREIGDYFFGQ